MNRLTPLGFKRLHLKMMWRRGGPEGGEFLEEGTSWRREGSGGGGLIRGESEDFAQARRKGAWSRGVDTEGI